MKRIFLLHIFSFSILLVWGQVNLQLSLNPATSTPPFRVNYGDTLTYNLEIINNDSVAFSGNVFVGFKGSNNLTYDSISLGILQIAPNGFEQRSISIDVQPQYFKTGPEVVVVWPIFDGKNGNEVADFIYVKSLLNGVEDELNPTKDYFIYQDVLSCSQCSLAFKRVRIFDLNGRVVFNQAFPTIPFELPVSNAGLYLMQLEALDGSTSIIKWLKH
jgi:hypothetical protein